jgi:hypothetical protein
MPEAPQDDSGGDTSFTNPNPCTAQVGGILVGTTFANQSVQQMWTAALYPYQNPSFTSFLLTGYSIIEVGDGIPAGNHTFTWATLYSFNVLANSIFIFDVTGGGGAIESNLPNTGSVVHNFAAPITHNAVATQVYQIRGTNTKSVYFYRTLTIYWKWRGYYGEDGAGPLIEAQVKALRVSGLQDGYAGTYVFVAGGYKYFAWPDVFGSPSSFTDQATGFPVAMQASYTVSITNAFGVTETYNVFRTQNILNSPITIVVA